MCFTAMSTTLYVYLPARVWNNWIQGLQLPFFFNLMASGMPFELVIFDVYH